ncbi:MAG: hypothetical protein MSIBF_07035 [Candidatus Altiarchaeales archaeon IMC4]|nr:MAG: hypothetical protein MSIBF_07035 [Candidatus Altiarchaeales archaeon IMC4]
MKRGLGQAIAGAIIGEARSKNYKNESFMDEENRVCYAVEWYSEKLGVDWNQMADKDLGQGDVRKFNTENAGKILKILGK